ncbi:MAG: protein of unknown function (DUF4440) [Verrucomicrobia bacterium]|nr:MAG: protein of unknown function (DUF4440) [Verrucomicrobiota bacterium]
MRRLLPTLALLLLIALPLRAQSLEEEVRVADTARVLSTLRGDADRLGRLLSDSLVYGHLNGGVQSKADLLSAVRGNRIKYEAYDYLDMKITRVSDEVAVITGRAHLKASAGPEHVDYTVRFLAVWRRESGDWHLYAYQSTRVADPALSPVRK